MIMGILDQLDNREKDIIMFRYGLSQGAEPQTLEQVGSRLGVTKDASGNWRPASCGSFARLPRMTSWRFRGLIARHWGESQMLGNNSRAASNGDAARERRLAEPEPGGVSGCRFSLATLMLHDILSSLSRRV